MTLPALYGTMNTTPQTEGLAAMTEQMINEVLGGEDTAPKPTLDLGVFAASGADPFISTVWPQVSGQLDEMGKMVADLKKFTPPSQADVYAYVKSEEGQNDPTIKAAYDHIKEMEATVQKLYAKARERATELMQPDSLPEAELAKLRETYGAKRTSVGGQLDAAVSYAKIMGKTELLEALEAVEVPRFTRGLGASASTPTNSESGKVREWAKAQGIKLADKGRVPAEVWAHYRAANPSA